MPQATETFFFVCTLSGWHSQEGGSSRTLEFESTCGGKTSETHFTCMWMGQRPDRNCGHEVLLLHDLWISTHQSPAGSGSRQGFGIKTRIGAINFAPE